ncbi:MAG: diaminopimelate epimerase [Oceanospirillaceae bacterium]|nr:diaminopimelate epimerase [Oceanospirillaceae bacterium]
MLLRFTKMHGLGNDFMVVDLVTQRYKFNPAMVKRLGDRKLGVGFDQLLIIEIPSNPDMDFRYRIFNSDGSEVEHCGNGARCFALFVRDKRLSAKTQLNVETAKGNMLLTIRDDRQVEVNMGPPILTPAQIPFIAEQQQASYPLQIDHQTLQISAVSMGNPHGVLVVDDVATAAVERLGIAIQQQGVFPESANIGFMQIVSRSEIKLRVYERSVGETLACGTGACAAVVAGRKLGLLDAKVTVNVTGGSLEIFWDAGDTDPVIMTGPATNVFEGKMFV